MENLMNYLFTGLIIVLSILILRINRRRDNSVVRDPGEALVEFGNAFPNEAIRSVMMDKTGRATFMRLADGKTGLVQLIGNQYFIRLIQPDEVQIELAQEGYGFILDFENDNMMSRVYQFSSHEETTEVAMWICQSFGLKMNEESFDIKTID